MARPCALSSQTVAALIAAKHAGMSQADAAAAAGVPERTLYDWLARGKRGEEPFATFHALYRAAERQARDDRRDALLQSFGMLAAV